MFVKHVQRSLPAEGTLCDSIDSKTIIGNLTVTGKPERTKARAHQSTAQAPMRLDDRSEDSAQDQNAKLRRTIPR
jgi:hypothetical protein